MKGSVQKAWISLVSVVGHFLGKRKAQNYFEMANEIINSFRFLECNITIKMHYLDSHLDRYPENLGDTSKEQGERLRQVIQLWTATKEDVIRT